MRPAPILLGAAVAVAAMIGPTGDAAASDLPQCPHVEYDGIPPDQGGTGPVWDTPDGRPPSYDCDGPGLPATTTTAGPTVEQATTTSTTPPPAAVAVPHYTG